MGGCKPVLLEAVSCQQHNCAHFFDLSDDCAAISIMCDTKKRSKQINSVAGRS